MQGDRVMPQYRDVPVPKELIDNLDLVFNFKNISKANAKNDSLFWWFTRATAWNTIKRVMKRAGVSGPMATSKGLRHAYGIAFGQDRVPPIVIAQLLGHSDTATTEIYTRPKGKEFKTVCERYMVMKKDQKAVGGSSMSQEPAIPAGSGSARKDMRREKYHDKMLRLGFKKLQPYVHTDDAESVLNYAKKKRNERLKCLTDVGLRPIIKT